MTAKLSIVMLGLAVVPAALGAGNAPAAQAPYSLTLTQKCLRATGAKVAQIRRSDRRRIAISDLAQRTSFEVRRGRTAVLFAFTKGPSEASLLRELLFVPGSSYVLVVKNNAVVMYQPPSRQAATAAMRCLRPR